MTGDHPYPAAARGLGSLRPLFRPVEMVPRVFFGVAFGAILLWEVYVQLSRAIAGSNASRAGSFAARHPSRARSKFLHLQFSLRTD